MLIYSIGVRREREENQRYCAVIGNDSMLVNKKKSKSFGTTKKRQRSKTKRYCRREQVLEPSSILATSRKENKPFYCFATTSTY